MARLDTEETGIFAAGEYENGTVKGELWKSITTNQLQVMPPEDLIPEVIRGIITYMNITNAAILYDETFSEYRDRGLHLVEGSGAVDRPTT